MRGYTPKITPKITPTIIPTITPTITRTSTRTPRKRTPILGVAMVGIAPAILAPV